MLTAQEASRVLLRYSPGAAPITWSQFATATGARSIASAKRGSDRWRSHAGDWISASDYDRERVRGQHPDWPPAKQLVPPSLNELLERRRPPARRQPASGELMVRPARPGERYRTWNYGTRDRSPDATDGRRVRTRTRGPSDERVVIVAHEGRRLVGSTIFYFADTMDDEQIDIQEIVGPGHTGPFFAEGDEQWGGHVIVMDSMWVAPDRRRAGIATAMGDLVAQIGLPGWGQFRDPWFAAFFLHHWPPTRSIADGTYWPIYGPYADATDWAEEDDAEDAMVELRLELSTDEFLEFGDDAASLVQFALATDDDPREALIEGGFGLEVLDGELRQRTDGWTVSAQARISYIEEPFLARAALEKYLLAPFDPQPPVESVGEAIDTVVIAAAVSRRSYMGLDSIAWQRVETAKQL